MSTPAQSDVDEILRFFSGCTALGIEEGRYFSATIPREATTREICDAATKVLAIPACDATKHSWELPCLFNGYGTGKTFTNFFATSSIRDYLARNPLEYPELRNTFANCFRIYLKQQPCQISYDNFCSDVREQLEPSVGLYLKWAIASQLLYPQDDFIIRRPRNCGYMMRQVVKEGLLDKLQYPAIFAAFRQKHNIASDAPIWIFIAHDGMQGLTGYDTLLNLKAKSEPNTIRNTELHQYLMESIAFAQAAKQVGINVLNIYSGSFPLYVTGVLEGTGHQWRPLTLEPMSVDDGIKLLSTKHPLLADKMNTGPFKQMLSHLGNIPGFWKVLSEIIGKKVNLTFDANTLADLKEQLISKVNCIFSSECNLNLLLLLTIQAWTFDEARQLLPATKMLHACSRQHAGHSFLLNMSYYVPPILLQSLAASFEIAIKRIVEYFPNRMLAGEFTSDNFKEFCMVFFTLKCNLLLSQGIHKVSVKEFFKGAWIQPEAVDMEIMLAQDNHKDHAKLHHTDSAKLLSLTNVKTVLGEVLDLTTDAPVAMQMRKDQTGILLLADTLLQFKMMYFGIGDAFGINDLSFESEQRLAENSPLRSQVKGHKFFVYLTNCQMTNDELKRNNIQHSNSIIICANNLKAVFSPTFEYATAHITSTAVVSLEDRTSTEELCKPKKLKRRNTAESECDDRQNKKQKVK